MGLASQYTPTPELAAFLEAGPPPIYIGFGSVVVPDPNALTSMIFAAVKMAGVRAIVSKGWGGIGGEEPPEEVLLLGNCPHDWLFPRVSCVVHHGGAGTTAIGIASGKPTVVVPFFGDQQFWGDMIARSGAGPKAVPFHNITAATLAESIVFALRPESMEAAQLMAQKIQAEDGKLAGVEQFHAALDIERMRCQIDRSRVAVYRHIPTGLRLSDLAATTLAKEGKIRFNKDLVL